MTGDLELAAALCLAAGDKSDGPARDMAYHLGHAIRALASPASPSRPVEAAVEESPEEVGERLAEAFLTGFDREYRKLIDASPPPRKPEGMDAATVEACAKVAEAEGVYPELNVYAGGPEWYRHGKRIAAAIRSLSPIRSKGGE